MRRRCNFARRKTGFDPKGSRGWGIPFRLRRIAGRFWVSEVAELVVVFLKDQLQTFADQLGPTSTKALRGFVHLIELFALDRIAVENSPQLKPFLRRQLAGGRRRIVPTVNDDINGVKAIGSGRFGKVSWLRRIHDSSFLVNT